jgi:hypothetical protein
LSKTEERDQIDKPDEEEIEVRDQIDKEESRDIPASYSLAINASSARTRSYHSEKKVCFVLGKRLI